MASPVRRKKIFGSHELQWKCRKSARASPFPHHTLDQERTARFTTRPFSALGDAILFIRGETRSAHRLVRRKYPDG